MKLDLDGFFFIAAKEALVPAPYLDNANVWTFGIGHAETSGMDPNPRLMGRGMPSDCELDNQIDFAFDIFKSHLEKYEDRVNRAVQAELTQAEFNVLVSFDLNTGAIFKASGTKALNRGDKADAIRRFGLYHKSGRPLRVNRGLVNRRASEANYWNTGSYSDDAVPVMAVTSSNRPGRVLRTLSKEDVAEYFDA